MFNNGTESWKLFQMVNHYLHSGSLMTLNFVPAIYARVQAKGSMCSPRGDWLRGSLRSMAVLVGRATKPPCYAG